MELAQGRPQSSRIVEPNKTSHTETAMNFIYFIPDEMNNLYGQNDTLSVQRKFEKTLLGWLIRTGDATPHREDNRNLPRSTRPA